MTPPALRRLRRAWLALALVAALGLATETALAHLLVGRDVAGRLLASGVGASAGWLALALTYLMMRLLVLVVLPAVVVSRASLAIYDLVRARRIGSHGSSGPCG